MNNIENRNVFRKEQVRTDFSIQQGRNREKEEKEKTK